MQPYPSRKKDTLERGKTERGKRMQGQDSVRQAERKTLGDKL